MAEMKFNCPSCTQLIACDELWSGQEIQCPICGKPLTVPAQQAAAASNPLVPKPPSGGSRLSIGQARHQASAVAPQAQRASAHIMGQKAKKTGAQRAKTFAVWGVVLAGLGAGVYFGWPYVRKYQDKLNTKHQQDLQTSDGGQVGHIANLNNVLDATDPSRPGGPRLPSDMGRVSRQVGAASKFPGGAQPSGVPGQPQTDAGGTNLPVVPATYTLNLATAKIPEGKVNGMIGATNFVADVIRVDPSAGAYVLQFVQGTVAAPDMGLRVYLHLKPGEKITNHTWKVSTDMTGGPTVTKLWKVNPKYAATSKNFSTGYALNLELGELKDGQIPGKIYLALPDTEQSFAAGVFNAQTTIGSTPATVAPTAALPAAAPAVSGQSAADRAAFEKRYGVGGKR